VTAKLAVAAAVTLANAIGLAIVAAPAWLLLAYGQAALPTALGAVVWLVVVPVLLLGRGRRQ
jgi:hypothetical protein